MLIDQVSGSSSVANLSPVNPKVERSSPVRPSPVHVCQLCLLAFSFTFVSFGKTRQPETLIS